METHPDMSLNSIYQEICETLGMDAAKAIYDMFKGQQISFPLHFYSPQSVKARIIEEYDGTNIRALAVKYEYSERTIRRIIRSSDGNGD